MCGFHPSNELALRPAFRTGNRFNDRTIMHRSRCAGFGSTSIFPSQSVKSKREPKEPGTWRGRRLAKAGKHPKLSDHVDDRNCDNRQTTEFNARDDIQWYPIFTINLSYGVILL